MSDKTITAVVSVLLGIIGVAVIAELVSKNANTGSVFGAFGGAIKQMLCTALSPVTGGNCGTSSIGITPTSSGGSGLCVPKPCGSGTQWNSLSCACESVQSTINF